MSAYTDEYLNLLIKQYYDQPNARGEITATAAEWERIYNFLNDVSLVLDPDTATGAQLELIGKIVGLPKSLLPFDNISDDAYRFYVKFKIVVNNTSAYLINEDYTGILDAMNNAFAGQNVVIFDNFNMTLTAQIGPDVVGETLTTLRDLDLLPRGQGVGYSLFVQAGEGYFGFEGNLSASGFGDGVDPSIGGPFALGIA